MPDSRCLCDHKQTFIWKENTVESGVQDRARAHNVLELPVLIFLLTRTTLEFVEPILHFDGSSLYSTTKWPRTLIFATAFFFFF